MAFNFKEMKQAKTKKPEEKKELKELTQEEKEYRERSRKERERFDLHTDTEFWMAICFKTFAEREEFLEMFDLPDGLIFGEEFKAKLAKTKPEKSKRQITPKGIVRPSKLKLFDDIEYTGYFALDLREETFKIYDTFRDLEPEENTKQLTDSGIYTVIYFESRQDIENTLQDLQILKYGDKYLDGSRWLKHLKNN